MPRPLSTEEKLLVLMQQAVDDREDGPLLGPTVGALRPLNIRVLNHAGFRGTKIFRILLTNACSFSCSYCPMRAERDLPRHALPPEKLAEFFIEARRRGWADGLFVTSGIPKSSAWAMDRMIALVELVRLRHRFTGYIHAKAVSGARPDQVERLASLVDRLSYNLEAACQATLDRLAPEKSLAQGYALLAQVRQFRRGSWRRAAGDPRPPGPPVRAGVTTQVVVGLDETTDREFLADADRMRREGSVRKAHFAAFRPISDTPLEDVPETPALRENRLYQAEHLLRLYGFSADELAYDERGHLPFSHDPKMLWALRHAERFPVEITTASREDLIRVPGIGPGTAERLLASRRDAVRLTARDVRKAGGMASRAAGFLAFRGRRLRDWKLQQPLFHPPEQPAQRHVYSFSPGTFR